MTDQNAKIKVIKGISGIKCKTACNNWIKALLYRKARPLDVDQIKSTKIKVISFTVYLLKDKLKNVW
jgi:hypothetical protein